MARMSDNVKSSSSDFGDISKLTNWMLDLGSMCHMTPQVSDFIPGLLEDTDKHIEVAEVHYVTDNQEGQARIKMCDNNGDTFIVTLQSVLLAPDICKGLFSNITLMNLVHTCLFHKGFCTV